MADSAAQVRECVRLLREWGHTVHEVDGWQRRGKGSMTTRGRINHHTAGGTGNKPSLPVVVHGRRGLRNSLSRWFVARDGTIYLVALRKSWHAGRGRKGSNSTLSGTEAEHSGGAGEAWGEASLAAQADIDAAECHVFGITADVIWDHKEHAPSRKVDRVNIDPAAWRDRVRKLTGEMRGGDEPEEDDEMQRIDVIETEQGVWLLDHPYAIKVPDPDTGQYYLDLAGSEANTQYRGPYQWSEDRVAKHPRRKFEAA